MHPETSFRDFVHGLSGTPHLAANIVRFLRPEDISKLLSTGRIFRHLVLLALNSCSSLREQLNGEASLATVLKGHWTKKELDNVLREGKFNPRHFKEIFVLDDRFFAISDKSETAPARLQVFNLTEQCVPGGSCLSSGRRIRVQIGNGSQLVVDNGDTIKVIRGNLSASNKVKKGEDLDDNDDDVAPVRPRFVTGDGSIYKLVKKEEEERLKWELIFYEEEEGHMVAKSVIPLEEKPTNILKQVCYPCKVYTVNVIISI